MPTLPTMTTKKMKIKGKILEILRVFTIREFFAYHEFSIVDFAYQDFSGELRACCKYSFHPNARESTVYKVQ